jgi:hypothetical protein
MADQVDVADQVWQLFAAQTRHDSVVALVLVKARQEVAVHVR